MNESNQSIRIIRPVRPGSARDKPRFHPIYRYVQVQYRLRYRYLPGWYLLIPATVGRNKSFQYPINAPRSRLYRMVPVPGRL
jgi:hypothetical protein